MNYNPIDTLRIDTAIIQQFNDDKAFHYTAEKPLSRYFSTT